MDITAAMVKQLRDMSGVAMMDCKKALVECEGNIDNALDLLRSNSALKAEKKASRIAADGVLKAYVGEEYATIVEINSETDFAAKDSQFINFTNEVEAFVKSNKIVDINILHESDIETKRKTLVQSIGENIQVRRLETLSYESQMNSGLYIHSDSILATVVVLNGGDESLAKDIAMHIAATNPICLSRDEIDHDVLEREKAIYLTQAKESGKPQEIMDKMVEGKLNRFLSEVSLISQPFVKDPDVTIEKLLNSHSASIESYARLKVGEGIEVETKNFADEVAEQLK